MKEKKIVQVVDEYAEWKNQVGWDKLNPFERMALAEKEGYFDVHVTDDPVTYELLPDQIDYTQKKLITKIKSKIANFISHIGIGRFMKNGMFNIKEIKGLENWESVKTGSIVTCNHFSPNDTFVTQRVLKASKKKKLYRVVLEGNYTNPPMLKFFMRNCDVLPLSSNGQTMKKFLRSVDEILKRGDNILVYPEQAMWINYRKPRPLKDGAFRFAAKNNVPVAPMFITTEGAINKNGEPMPLYTVHILQPIYPKQGVSLRENIEYMKNLNYEMWVKLYEEVYGEKLQYLIKD